MGVSCRVPPTAVAPARPTNPVRRGLRTPLVPAVETTPVTQPDPAVPDPTAPVPALRRLDAPGTPRAVIPMLHGGKQASTETVDGRSASWRRSAAMQRSVAGAA